MDVAVLVGWKGVGGGRHVRGPGSDTHRRGGTARTCLEPVRFDQLRQCLVDSGDVDGVELHADTRAIFATAFHQVKDVDRSNRDTSAEVRLCIQLVLTIPILGASAMFHHGFDDLDRKGIVCLCSASKLVLLVFTCAPGDPGCVIGGVLGQESSCESGPGALKAKPDPKVYRIHTCEDDGVRDCPYRPLLCCRYPPEPPISALEDASADNRPIDFQELLGGIQAPQSCKLLVLDSLLPGLVSQFLSELASGCRASALGSQGVETHLIHFAKSVLRLKSWSDSGCPSGWIQIVCVCGAHMAVFTGSSSFELPSSGTPTFSEGPFAFLLFVHIMNLKGSDRNKRTFMA
ncbi:hypothetical protein JEQ12_013626 [Ovis aries]|uniref:Uncharacterized protein n=1 Tax=Ovis aries TaxID=9940 RepID=A0A836AI45_SHEEP|nr:hypothetical protein JEQ12_013626 [Ovis aries]